MSTSAINSADDRWNYIDEKDPEGSIALSREILRDYGGRLDALDVNGSSLIIPPDYISQTMLKADSVGSAQIQADAVTGSEIAAGAVGAGEIATDAVETDKLKAGAVTGPKLAAGIHKGALIAGGLVGTHAVTGIATGDELVWVHRMGTTFADLTSEFSITGADTLTNTTTDTTGDYLQVYFLDKT